MVVPLLLISDEPRWLENELRRVARGAEVNWTVLGGLALLSADADAVVVATDDLAHPRLLALFRSLYDGLGVRRCLLLNLGQTRDLRPLLEAPPAHVLHLPDEVAELPAALRALVSALVFDDLTSWLAPNLPPSLNLALPEVLLVVAPCSLDSTPAPLHWVALGSPDLGEARSMMAVVASVASRVQE